MLEFIEPSSVEDKPNIHQASFDEIRKNLGVTNGIAKQIIMLRASEGQITEKSLLAIKGIGPKTLDKAKEIYSFKA